MSAIERQYQAAAANFSGIESHILKDIEKSNLKDTNAALYKSIKKIDLLLQALIHASSSFYVSQALLRVLLEHYLVGHYIWTRSRIEKSDICGYEYRVYYLCSEFLKRENYELGVDNIRANKNVKVDLELIKARHPELEQITDKEVHNIHTVANQFDVRKIGQYLVHKVPSDDSYHALHKAMLQFLDTYNHLSSYVHGGPFADKQSFSDEVVIDREQIVRHNIEWGKIASKQSKINLMASLNLDFPNHYNIPLQMILAVD